MEGMSDTEGVLPFLLVLHSVFIIITKTTNIINLNVADVAVRLLLGYQSLIEYKPLDSVTVKMHESEMQKNSYLVAVNCC